jgi:hypothetical protein
MYGIWSGRCIPDLGRQAGGPEATSHTVVEVDMLPAHHLQILSNKARIIVDLQSNLTPWASAALQVWWMCDVDTHTMMCVHMDTAGAGLPTCWLSITALQVWWMWGVRSHGFECHCCKT